MAKIRRNAIFETENHATFYAIFSKFSEIDENSLDKLFEVLEQKQKQFWNPLIPLQPLACANLSLLLEKKIVIRLQQAHLLPFLASVEALFFCIY